MASEATIVGISHPARVAVTTERSRFLSFHPGLRDQWKLKQKTSASHEQTTSTDKRNAHREQQQKADKRDTISFSCQCNARSTNVDVSNLLTSSSSERVQQYSVTREKNYQKIINLQRDNSRGRCDTAATSYTSSSHGMDTKSTSPQPIKRVKSGDPNVKYEKFVLAQSLTSVLNDPKVIFHSVISSSKRLIFSFLSYLIMFFNESRWRSRLKIGIHLLIWSSYRQRTYLTSLSPILDRIWNLSGRSGLL